MSDPLYLNIAIAGVCVLLSALVAKLILVGFKRNHFGFVMLWMMIFPVSLIAAFIYVVPEAQHWRARILARGYIQDDPLFSQLAERNLNINKGLEELMSGLIEAGHPELSVRMLAFKQGLGFLMPEFESYLPAASDEAQRRYLLSTFQVLRDLRGKSGVACYWFVTGSPQPDGSTLERVSDVKLEDLNLAMADVVRSATNDPVARMTEEERMAYGQEVFRRLEARLGEDFGEKIALLDRPDRSNADREIICDVVYELYQEVNRLPSPFRERATRAILLK